MCDLVGKADLLSGHFDGKQFREPVDRKVALSEANFCVPLRCSTSCDLWSHLFRAVDLYRAVKVLPCVGWEEMVSQLDLRSLAQFSLAGGVDFYLDLPIGLLQ